MKKDKFKLSEKDREVFRRMGKRGGAARAKRLTPKQRSDIARKATKARWDKETEQ